MRITPLDVRKQDFRKAVRGFDCDEVRAFLTTLADEYEIVLIDNKQLRETIAAQDEKIGEYRNIEGTLRDTLMTAQKVLEDTRENARREAGLIVQEAQQQSRQILEECRRRTEELRREIMTLRKEKEAYLARFRNLAQAQIQFVDTHESDFETLDKRLLEIADSVTGGLEVAGVPSPAAMASPKRPEPAPDPEPQVSPAGERRAAPPGSPELDVWRDYRPAAPERTSARSLPSEPTEKAEAEVPDEILQTIAALDDCAPKATDAGALSRAADLAALGIPVPAIDPFLTPLQGRPADRTSDAGVAVPV